MTTGRFLRRAAATAICLVLGACSGPQPIADELAPREVARPAQRTDRAPVALVLSGGSARGFAHVGVLKVLEENGLEPDFIVGSSAGALVGALYASGMPVDDVDEALAGLEMSDLGSVLWPRLGVIPGALGFVSGDKLKKYVKSRLPMPLIESFPHGFAAVATDVDTGEPIAFNTGDAATAIEASMAVPVVYAPVSIGGRRFVDGQVASPVPVQAARRLGARRVIAIDVIYPPQDSSLTSPLRVLFQAFLVSTYRLREMQLREADLVIAPRIRSTSGQMGLGERERLIAAGEEAARAALPELRAMLRHKTR